MALISKSLRNWVCRGDQGQPLYEGLTFWCPGCKHAHSITTQVFDGKGRPSWSWNGDAEKPVFGPSILCTTGHHATKESPENCATCKECKADGEPTACSICHSFVGCNGAEPGQIIFLSDCTHELAGRVMALPDWPIPDWGDPGD